VSGLQVRVVHLDLVEVDPDALPVDDERELAGCELACEGPVGRPVPDTAILLRSPPERRSEWVPE